MADSAQRARRRVATLVRDKYRIDAFIATGSMSHVYAATHRNGSRVALKILHRDLANDPTFVERFRREGYFANVIGHPGVVRAIDDDVTEDGCPFIVLELLEGETLEERRVRSGGRLPLLEVLHIGDAMLDVLAVAHGHEILHRDINPTNVFLTRKDEVKLLDFGAARFNDGKPASDVTAVGVVLGTLAFMAPEQAAGRREHVDARSDVWGVGATLFTAITGEPVHPGPSARANPIGAARQPVRSIREVMPRLPTGIAAVVDRALVFDRAGRWADAKSMRDALRSARRILEERVEPDPPTVAIPRDDRAPIAGAAPAPRVRRSTAPGLGDASREALDRQSDGVITSAAPLTVQEPPRSMEGPEDPTFSLRRFVEGQRAPSDPPRGSRPPRMTQPMLAPPPQRSRSAAPGAVIRTPPPPAMRTPPPPAMRTPPPPAIRPIPVPAIREAEDAASEAPTLERKAMPRHDQTMQMAAPAAPVVPPGTQPPTVEARAHVVELPETLEGAALADPRRASTSRPRTNPPKMATGAGGPIPPGATIPGLPAPAQPQRAGLSQPPPATARSQRPGPPSQAPPGARPSLPPAHPGPLLSQIVPRKSRSPARFIVPPLLALIVFVVWFYEIRRFPVPRPPTAPSASTSASEGLPDADVALDASTTASADGGAVEVADAAAVEPAPALTPTAAAKPPTKRHPRKPAATETSTSEPAPAPAPAEEPPAPAPSPAE